MSEQPTLSLAAGYHLRAKALCDGRVGLKSFDLRAIAYENDGLGHDEFMAGKFDAGEFSLAMYLALKSRGAPYMAIPVFPNRKFRQSYIFVPEGSPLTEAKQLKGKKVGIPSWLNTAGLWARGILSDEYGVKPADIHWVMPRKNKVDVTLPAGTRLDVVPAGNPWRRACSKANSTRSSCRIFPRSEAGVVCSPIPKPWNRISFAARRSFRPAMRSLFTRPIWRNTRARRKKCSMLASRPRIWRCATTPMRPIRTSSGIARCGKSRAR